MNGAFADNLPLTASPECSTNLFGGKRRTIIGPHTWWITLLEVPEKTFSNPISELGGIFFFFLV
jgi:hypothetical protein